MGNIRLLDEQIANQIAAGEVVERPASVVKELVENAIDASSTRIEVDIEDGGLELVRVRDNGEGILPEDLPRAFERHATSKLASGKDLFRILSLGFRGEALPSIAAVSKLECVTMRANESAGRKIVIHGGHIVTEEHIAADQGTDISVQQLFYNTPARLKYMKTVQTELSHISDYMYRLALSRADIAFIFRHNGKTLLQTSGRGDVQQVIAAIYGVGTAKQMVQIEGKTADYTCSGWVSRPELTRAGRHAITTIINGRYIRNYSLIKAILNGYHTLLPVHRFPLAVLNVTMDPALIDVNVHPSKLEVRFSKEKELFTFLEETVQQAMNELVLIPVQSRSEKLSKQKPIQEQLKWDRHSNETSEPPQSGHGKTSSHSESEPSDRTLPNMNRERSYSANRTSTRTNARTSAWQQTPKQAVPKETFKEVVNRYVTAEGSERADEADKKSALPTFPELHPVGQVKGTYIVAQNDEGLYLIDQHAAHERIQYELYYTRFGNPVQVSQELLIPITLELTPSDAEALAERMNLLEQVGVYVQPFGGHSYKVTSYPHWLPAGEEKDVIEELIEWVLEERRIDLAKLREKSAILCSCKAAIKANQSLSNEQISALLSDLSRCHNPYTCPHGRPIVVSFSNYELEKMFKRVM